MENKSAMVLAGDNLITHVPVDGFLRNPAHVHQRLQHYLSTQLTPDQSWAADTLEGANLNQLDFDISLVDKVLRMYLEFTVTPTVDMTLIPPELMFATIGFATNKGQDVEVSRWNAQALYWINYGFRKSLETDRLNLFNIGNADGYITDHSVAKANVAKTFKLDLSALYPVLSNTFGGAYDAKVQLITHGATYLPGALVATDGATHGTAVVAGQVSNTTTPKIIVDEFRMEPDQRKRHIAMHKKYPQQDHHLVPFKKTLTVSSLTASTDATNSIVGDFQSVTGNVAFILIGIRNDVTLSNHTGGVFDLLGSYQSLGPNGQIDILTPGGESILQRGTVLKVHRIEERMSRMLPTDWLIKKNIYMITFSQDPVNDFWKGHKKGYFTFNKTAYYLKIVPDAAGVLPTLVIDDDTGAFTPMDAGGEYWFEYDGQRTKRFIVDSDEEKKVEAINFALEKLLAPHGLSATANESYGQGTDGAMTITFDQPPKNQNSKQLHFFRLPIRTDTNHVEGTTTWTSGTPGFVANPNASGAYSIDCQFFIWENTILDTGGALTKKRWAEGQ